jgi:type II secretory pathway pseudopilin PulG
MKLNITLQRPSFTLLELLFSIVILTILSSLALSPVTYDNTLLRQQAIDAILSDIRYTQHLALIDHKHDFDAPKWQRGLWTFKLQHCNTIGWFYTITSNKLYVNQQNHLDAAIDPTNHKPMFYNCTTPSPDTHQSSPRIFLKKRYNITHITAHDGCNNYTISFDHLGRAFNGFHESASDTYANYMSSPCHFTFIQENTKPFTLTILPETGFVFKQ